MEFFYNLNVYNQALIASIIAMFMTISGAATVFLFKKVNKSVMESMVAVSAGIMLAAAIFSLLLPSIEQATELNMNTSLVVTISILMGSLLLIVGDLIASKKIKDNSSKTSNVLLLVLSIVLHNIPEGMAIGVAFGSIVYNLEGATVAAAISIALGIAIQNFPEGAAISIPIRRLGISRTKAFLIGASTGIVEPLSALVGVYLVLKIKLILPFLLAFAAGAMIFVIVSELIPEALENKRKNLMTYLFLIGFVLMMLLELM